MAGAIVDGIIKKEHTNPSDIYCHSPFEEELTVFTNRTKTNPCTSNTDVVKNADAVILAVKPNVFPLVLSEIKDEIAKKKPLIISIAAGTTLDKIESLLYNPYQVSIVRVMPNVNVMVGEGMSAVCGNKSVTKEQLQFVLKLFEAVGSAVELAEKDFSTFTAIAGSSPAYAYLFIDALARGAVKNGMPKDLSTKIAAKAVLGSARMLLEGDESPWNLIDKVCSPGGTTIAGLMALEDEKFFSTVVKCVDVTISKDKDLMK